MQAIPELREDQLKELVERRMEETGGLLTDEGAAHIVAYELGVTLRREDGFETEIQIEDLTSGINDVSLSGRVLLVEPPRTFTRKDGTEGGVTKILLGDSTGVVDVAVWEDKTNIIEKERIEPEQTIRILHGYVREGLNGQPEINIGKRGSIHKMPKKASDNYPRVRDYSLRIGQIKDDTKFLNLEGRVERVYPLSQFERADGTEGKARRILLSDDTGEILCVFWNDKAELVENAKVGDLIEATATSARKGWRGTEVHTTRVSEITITEAGETVRRGKESISISDIRSGTSSIDLLAWVMQVGNTRKFTTKEGNEGEVVTLLLADETGSIRLNLWNEKARETSKINRGDLLSIRNAYVRTWHENVTLNLGSEGEINVSEDKANRKQMPKPLYRHDKIRELKEEQSFVSIGGKISRKPQVRSVTGNRGSQVKVATFGLKDETAEIDVTLWGELAELVENLSVGTELKIRGGQVDMRGGAKRVKSNVLTTISVQEEDSPH